MTSRVTFSNEALHNLERIRAYYLLHGSENVVRAFFEDLNAACLLIAASPGAGRPTRRVGTRAFRLGRYPYLMFYKVYSDGELRIIQVRHARRRPLKLS